MRIQKRNFCLNVNTKNRNGNTIYLHFRLFRLFGFTIYQEKNKKIGFRCLLMNHFIGY